MRIQLLALQLSHTHAWGVSAYRDVTAQPAPHELTAFSLSRRSQTQTKQQRQRQHQFDIGQHTAEIAAEVHNSLSRSQRAQRWGYFAQLFWLWRQQKHVCGAKTAVATVQKSACAQLLPLSLALSHSLQMYRNRGKAFMQAKLSSALWHWNEWEQATRNRSHSAI